MKNQEIKFRNKNYSYSIIIGKNALNVLPKKLKLYCTKTKKIALIIDNKIPLKFKKNLKNKLKNYNLLFLPFSSNEKNKSLNTINKYLKILLSKNFNRSDLIISMGGGLQVMWQALLLAFLRGVNFINIPTSLLAQVDSSIGGKTGVNSIYVKILYSFYQPKLVISDTFINSYQKRNGLWLCRDFKDSIIKIKNFLTG